MVILGPINQLPFTMSSTCGYLVPDRSFPIGEFKRAIIAFLEKEQIISYDADTETSVSEDLSLSLFNCDIHDSGFAFEYATIHDTINRRLVPEEWGEGDGANCQKCQSCCDSQFSEALCDLYELEYENNQETDMALLTIPCGNCGHINHLMNMQLDTPAEIANQYIQFIDIENDFHPGKVKELNTFLNCNLKVFYSRL